MKRWVVHSTAEFEAHHALKLYHGRAEASHHHRWRVAIKVGADTLTDEGYAVDFHAVHRLLADAVAPLDGCDLNAHPLMGEPTPSAERVAEVLAAQLGPQVERVGARLLQLSVWEGPGNRVDLNLEA